MVQFPTYFPIGDGLISLSKYCMMILYIQTWNQGSLTSLVVLSQFHRVTFLGRKTISSSSLGDSFEAGRSELDGAKKRYSLEATDYSNLGPAHPSSLDVKVLKKTASKKNTCEPFFYIFFGGVCTCLHFCSETCGDLCFFLRLWRDNSEMLCNKEGVVQTVPILHMVMD